MNNSEGQPIETLRITGRDKAKLLWAIEESSSRPVEDSKRRLRVAASNNEAVLAMVGDNGARTRFSVIARDLSRRGASVLHGRYVYPGSRCELELKTLDGDWHTLAGEIRHSRHVQGLIHNLGIEFDDAIDLYDFVMLSPEEETRHLQELAEDTPEEDGDDVRQLLQRVLIVDDFSSDRKLYSYWMSQAGMDVVSVGDTRSAMEQVEAEQYDLIIVDARLNGESGYELMGKLRSVQYVGPILAVSAYEEDGEESAVQSSGANAFLLKPFTSEQLIETSFNLLGLSVDADTTPIFSTFKDDAELRPLLTAFTRALPKYIEQLHTANSKNDYETLQEIAHTLKGAGSSYGLDEITELSGSVLVELSGEASDVDKIKQSVNDLIAVINRVKVS